MAPKKKAGRKKEEEKKEPEIDEDIVPEHSREFYLIQIRDLEGRLARYQKKWDELQVSEELFRTEYEKMLQDNKEIVAFLKKTLNQRTDEIADLSDQLHHLQQAKDTEKDAFEAQLAQLRHEFQETKDQLTSENMTLSGKLAALEEFRLQKAEILTKFSDLEGQLKKQEDDHKEFIYNLERKSVLDKERLKKEMLHRVNAVAAEFRKVSNNQMAETTKRTIRENVTISLQLNKVTEQSLHLAQQNDRLKQAHGEVVKQLKMLEQNEKKMAKNSLSNQKVIWMLTEKCKELQVQEDEYMQQKKIMAELQKAKEVLEKQNAALQEELKMQKKEMKQKTRDNQDLQKALQEERQRRLNMERVLNCAAQGLKEVLLERPSHEEEDGQFDVMFHLRRNDMMLDILSTLDKGVTRVDEALVPRPFPLESKPMTPSSDVVERTSHDPLLHLRLSRIVSHSNIFKRPNPQSVHSMPSLTRLHQSCIDTFRPYSSATELQMTTWKAKADEEEDQGQEVVLQEETVLQETVPENASRENLSKAKEPV